MRTQRQNAILKLISEHEIETQQDLAQLLAGLGFQVTQATISRDIKELRLVKAQSESGRVVYKSAAGISQGIVSDRLRSILSQSLVSVDYAQNNVVIKTISAGASAAAAAVDAMELAEVLGCIAGDDTILVIARSEKGARKVYERLKSVINLK